MSDIENHFWHYTVAPILNKLMEKGFIDLATLYLPEHEIPVVWFSSNISEEKTIRKGITNKKTGERVDDLGRDELFKYGIPQARIEVDVNKTNLFKWVDYWHKTNISTKEAEAIMGSGRKMGANPDDWWCSFEPVPVNAFINIDVWDGNKWARYWSPS